MSLNKNTIELDRLNSMVELYRALEELQTPFRKQHYYNIYHFLI